MTDTFKKYETCYLLRIWTGRTDEQFSDFDREEALWEYWRRFALEDEPVALVQIREMFESGLRGIGNVVGELARRNKFNRESIEFVLENLEQLPAHEKDWALIQLDAREALIELIENEGSRVLEKSDRLIGKGTYWAVHEALSVIGESDRKHVMAEVVRRNAFTRGQRHDLKQFARRLAQEN